MNSANDNEVQTMCGVCNREVHDNHHGVGCEGRCQKWFHCHCINMSELEYNNMANDSSRTWICDSCKTPSQAVEQVLNTAIPIYTQHKYVHKGWLCLVSPKWAVEIVTTSEAVLC